MTTNQKRIMLLSLAVGLVIGAFFTATQDITATHAKVSAVFILLFAAPTYFFIVKKLGSLKGIGLLLSLGVFALIVESSAINTGFPYGDFVYNELLGSKVFGLTPWTVSFAWPPILLLSYTLAMKIDKRLLFLTLTYAALLAMVVDIVLDPAAVSLGFWYWSPPGFFYGVPLVNFAGWMLTGFFGAIIAWYFIRKNISKEFLYSGIAILWFWSWVNIFQWQLLPAVVGFALLLIIFRKFKLKSVY